MKKITIVGESNVGKSSLFNRLMGKKLAITAFEAGTTRDAVSGICQIGQNKYQLTDTAGIIEKKSDLIAMKVQGKLNDIFNDTDLFLFLVNGRIKPSDLCIKIAKLLNKLNKPIILILNKIDTQQVKPNDLWINWIIKNPLTVSTLSGRNIFEIEEKILQTLPSKINKDETAPKIALFGRPNVGKSSLINGLIEEERLITSDIPGTTRDIIPIYLKKQKISFCLLDTPGIRKRGKIKVGIEKFGAEHAIGSIKDAKLVLLVVDAVEGATRQDVHLAQIIHHANVPLQIVFNKSDLIKQSFFQRFAYLDKFEQISVSAKTGYNLDKLKDVILKRINQ